MQGKVDALRDRLPKMWEASPRVTASIDLKTVLQEVLENARVVVGARWRRWLRAIGEART